MWCWTPIYLGFTKYRSFTLLEKIINCGPQLRTIFLFLDTKIKLPVLIQIMKVVTILWFQITLESRIGAFRRLRPLGSSLSNHDNCIDSEKCLSAHCDFLACSSLPFDTRAGINFYLISDKHKLDITIAGSHSLLVLFLMD